MFFFKDEDNNEEVCVHNCRKLSSIGSRFTDHKLPIKFASAQYSTLSIKVNTSTEKYVAINKKYKFLKMLSIIIKR